MSITLSNLKAIGRWPEALELAIKTNPEEVESILSKAGNSYLIRGEYQKLHDLLAGLEASYQNQPETLFWLFRTAFRIRNEHTYLNQVKQLLSKEIAPNLRALYATHFIKDASKLIEIRRAKKDDSNFFIRHHYALALLKDNPEKAIAELEDLCSSATAEGHSFDYLQALDLLGYSYAQQGRFKKTTACFKKAHAIFARESQFDWQLYLSSCNNYLQNQIIINEFDNDASLVDSLFRNQKQLLGYLEFDVRATLGDYWLSKGDLSKAFDQHKQNFEAFSALSEVNSLYSDSLVFNYVKMLLLSEQMLLASELLHAYQQTKQPSPGSQLAECLVLSSNDPVKVREILEAIDSKGLTIDLQIIRLALLANCYISNDIAKANALLSTRSINDLSLEAFRVILGSSTFDHVYHFWQGNDLLPIIQDPKAFEELANDEVTWHRLALLKDFPGELEQVRYAHYLSSQYRLDEALEVMRAFKPNEMSSIALGTYLGILLTAGELAELESLISQPLSEDPSPLSAEGRMRSYEAIAGYLHTRCNESKLAQKYLYWEQAIANELRLSRRLNIIEMLLEDVNQALGEVSILEPVHLSGLKHTIQKRQRQRFDSILHETNFVAAKQLVDEHQIDECDYRLIEALKVYRDAELGQGSFSNCIKYLKDEPKHPESSLYQSLLALQLFAKLGVVTPTTDLTSVLTRLKAAVQNIPNLEYSYPITAKLFPLGLAMAAYLLPKFKSALVFVPIILDQPKQKGIFLANQRLATLSPIMCEAIVQDGLKASRTSYENATSSKTGYTINKKRFEQALEKADLKVYELTNTGAIVRGLSYCKNEADYAEVVSRALQEPYLKSLVNIL